MHLHQNNKKEKKKVFNQPIYVFKRVRHGTHTSTTFSENKQSTFNQASDNNTIDRHHQHYCRLTQSTTLSTTLSKPTPATATIDRTSFGPNIESKTIFSDNGWCTTPGRYFTVQGKPIHSTRAGCPVITSAPFVRSLGLDAVVRSTTRYDHGNCQRSRHSSI
jgi:hypothetical protein